MKTLTLSMQQKYAVAPLFAFVALVWIAAVALPFDAIGSEGVWIGIDWRLTFRPALLAMLHGQSPYIGAMMLPPWALLPLVPLAALPETVSTAAMVVLGYFAYGLAAHRIGAKPAVIAIFLLSPLVLNNARNGNVDWMIALGATLPPQIGLFFVLVKPQLGLGIAAFWLVEAWRTGRLREVVRVFGPVVAAYLISFAVFGPWIFRMQMVAADTRYTLFPRSIPIGLVLLVIALRSRSIKTAIASSPFLAPYLSGHGWQIAVFALLPNLSETAAAVAGLWVLRWMGLL